MNRARVKLVAVAKNEAYFLPQWIFHHFYMGFDAIDVYINRSVDNSAEILGILRNYYPNLSFYSADWIDKIGSIGDTCNTPMQFAAYTFAHEKTLSGFDYVMFIDVDEFWLPKNGWCTIQHCIRRLDYPDMIHFEWFCSDGLDDYKMPITAADKIEGISFNNGKTLIRTDIDLDFVRLHTQPVVGDFRCVLADGEELTTLDSNPDIVAHRHLRGLKDYFLLHDWKRSPLWHLSNIGNGHATLGTKDAKFFPKSTKVEYNNRFPGYIEAKFKITLLPDYLEKFAKITRSSALEGAMVRARKSRLLLALDAIRRIKSDPNSKLSQMLLPTISPLEDLHMQAIAQIREHEPDFPEGPIITDPATLQSGTHEEIIANFALAMRLYPYAMDSEGAPLFARAYIEYLFGHGNLNEAIAFLNSYEKTIPSLFGRTWKYLTLARNYEKAGKPEEALRNYKCLRFLRNDEVKAAIARLRK